LNNYNNNIINKYFILYIHNKNIISNYLILSGKNISIYLSSDKYGYNSNLVGVCIVVNYNDAQYQSIMNNQSIVLSVNQYYVSSNYTSYTTSTNLLTNITS